MKKAKVRIDVVGGIAHIVECPDSVELEVRNYDVEDSDENILIDRNGDCYISLQRE